jgi:uncharacterized protein YybS (DUF2232 family)
MTKQRLAFLIIVGTYVAIVWMLSVYHRVSQFMVWANRYQRQVAPYRNELREQLLTSEGLRDAN